MAKVWKTFLVCGVRKGMVEVKKSSVLKLFNQNFIAIVKNLPYFKALQLHQPTLFVIMAFSQSQNQGCQEVQDFGGQKI